MKKEPDGFERFLAGMSLARPSLEMDGRVLGARPRRRRAWLLGGAALAAAAVVAVVLLTGSSQAPPEPKPTPPSGRAVTEREPPAQPLRVDYEVLQLIPEGLAVDGRNMPFRAYRRLTVQHTWLLDEDEDVEAFWSVPREDVVFVRAEVY